MSYVPVYATVSDNVSNHTGHTTSRRGKVTNVEANINTHFGEALRVGVSSLGNLPRKSELYAEMKISYFKSKNNIKKVVFWEQRLKEYKTYNEAQAKEERCGVSIELTGLDTMHPKKFAYKFGTKTGSYYLTSENLIDVFNNWDEISKMLPKMNIARALEEGNKRK